MCFKNSLLFLAVLMAPIPTICYPAGQLIPAVLGPRKVNHPQIQQNLNHQANDRSERIYRAIAVAAGGTIAFLYCGTLLLMVKYGANP